MIAQGSIESLIDFFSFTAWIFYGMSMAALLVLRWKKPDIARPYKVKDEGLLFLFKLNVILQVPVAIPIVVLISSVFLVIAPIINEPKMEYLYSMTFMAFGALIYVPFVYYKLRLPFLGN